MAIAESIRGAMEAEKMSEWLHVYMREIDILAAKVERLEAKSEAPKQPKRTVKKKK